MPNDNQAREFDAVIDLHARSWFLHILNAHGKTVFEQEAAGLMLRSCDPVKAWMRRQEPKHGKRKALSVLEVKIGGTVYRLWRKQCAFDAKRFLKN